MKPFLVGLFGIVLIGALPGETLAQAGSCNGWNATCKARCKDGGTGCLKYCANQLRSCKKSGCWTEGARFGGGRHCGLKKS